MKNQKGFSLIEIVIVLFIIGVLSAVLVVSFRTGEKQRSVNASADIIINAVRNAQNYTLASKSIDTTCVHNGANDKSPASYRAVLDAGTNSVKLTAEDKCGNIYEIETYRLPERARIKGNGTSVTISGSTTNYEAVQVKFTTPFAVTTVATSTFITAPFVSYQTVGVVVESSDSSVSKTITVDGISGRIGE